MPEPEELGLDELGLDELGLDELGLDELGLDELGLDELGLDELGLDELGLDELGLDELGFDELGFDELELDELGFDEPELTSDESSVDVVSEEISLLSVLFDDASSLLVLETCEELGISVSETVLLVPQAAKAKSSEGAKSNAINFLIFIYLQNLYVHFCILCTIYYTE